MALEPIDDDAVQGALERLSETDEVHARAKARLEAMRWTRKVLEGQAFLDAEGKSVAEREARAASCQAVRAWIEDYENAWADYQLLENQRGSDERIYELYRTMSANQRMGR